MDANPMNEQRLSDVGDSMVNRGLPVGGPPAADGVLEANLAMLASISSDLASAVRRTAPSVAITTEVSRTGVPVLAFNGRALDSRRDPVSAAEHAASHVSSRRVVLFGLGGGYLAETLISRGIAVVAIVEQVDIVRAALSVRDLRHVLASVPIVGADAICDLRQLSRLRALAGDVVVHTPSAQVMPELRVLAERWHRVPAARRPRVLVIGPISGGSLGVARSVATAVEGVGAELRFFDPSPFAAGQSAFTALDVDRDGRAYLQGRLTLLLGDAATAIAAEWRPDLAIAMAQAPTTEPALTRLRQLGTTSAFWFVENVRVLPYWREVCRDYDFFYAIQPGATLERIEEAGARRVAYLPMACDPAMHRPVTLTAEERARYGSRVSFAGAPYLNRRHVLGTIADLGFKVWGEGWESTALASHLGAPGRFGREEMLRIFSATDVNVNLHSADHVTGLDPDADYVNPRTFELAACGAFQLVDRRDPLSELFKDDELVTFRNAGELRELTKRFLADPDGRAGWSARARARVLAEHTYEHRVQQILSDTLPPHLQPCNASPGLTLDEAIGRAAFTAELSQDEALLRMVADVRETVANR
jgi:spore maturation protein CgeB